MYLPVVCESGLFGTYFEESHAVSDLDQQFPCSSSSMVQSNAVWLKVTKTHVHVRTVRKYSILIHDMCIHICTTEALEIKRAACSICLRRIVALCGLGVYVVRPGVYGVPSQQILYSARPSRAKTGFPAHSVVQTGYTTPTLRFSDTLNSLVGVV